MLSAPKTLLEAKSYKYSVWAGNSKGLPYKPEKCAYEIFRDYVGRQCARSNGHGPENLYCKQHAKMVSE
jgi:hypothetical protein